MQFWRAVADNLNGSSPSELSSWRLALPLRVSDIINHNNGWQRVLFCLCFVLIKAAPLLIHEKSGLFWGAHPVNSNVQVLNQCNTAKTGSNVQLSLNWSSLRAGLPRTSGSSRGFLWSLSLRSLGKHRPLHMVEMYVMGGMVWYVWKCMVE